VLVCAHIHLPLVPYILGCLGKETFIVSRFYLVSASILLKSLQPKMFRRDPFAETNSRLEREMAILASERAMERKSSMGKAPATVVEINPAAPPPSTDIVPEKWAMETEVEPIDERHGNLKNAKSTTSAQRKLIAFAVLAILVFVLNAVPVIGFGIGSFGFKDESHQSYGSLSGVIYEGTCTQTKTFDFWIHLLINVLSTALLMGNSKAMQTLRLLVANGAGESRLSSHPQVHSTSRPRGALALWIILGLSSVPIHLLYNSSIYETIGATGFSWAIVGQDFLESGPASIGPNGLDNSFGPIYADMRANGSTWERLNNSECIQTYGADYLTDRGNVLLITSNNDSASSMYQYGSAGAAQYGTSFGWMCEQEYQYTSVPTAKCNLSELEASAANWTLGIKDPGPSYPIKYCLSESITSHCWVQLKWSFLLSVAAFNLLKVICLILCVVITRKSRCMLTVGDMQVHKPRWWIQAPSPFVVVAAVLLSIGGIAAAAVGLNKAFMNEQGFGKSIDFKSLSVPSLPDFYLRRLIETQLETRFWYYIFNLRDSTGYFDTPIWIRGNPRHRPPRQRAASYHYLLLFPLHLHVHHNGVVLIVQPSSKSQGPRSTGTQTPTALYYSHFCLQYRDSLDVFAVILSCKRKYRERVLCQRRV
jgi:hypothetical protein